MNGDPVRIWEMKGIGIRIDLYTNGKVIVWHDPTYHVRTDNGAGPRENTATLYGYVELTPRPARGTRALDRASAPTELQ